MEEAFPIPTYVNPHAVFEGKKKNDDIDQREKSKRKIVSLDKEILKAEKTTMYYYFNERKDKLANLRKRLLEGKRSNESQVLEEEKAKNQSKSKVFLKKQYELKKRSEINQKLNELSYLGVNELTEDPERLLKTSARSQKEMTKAECSRQNQLNSLNRGGMFNIDSAFHAYNRRVKNLSDKVTMETSMEDRKTELARIVEQIDHRRDLIREKKRHKQETSVAGGISMENDKYNDRLSRAFDKFKNP